jgi:hypothetical protein
LRVSGRYGAHRATTGVGRSATLPDLAGRIHAFEQRGEIDALDPDELDAAGRLK